jgi:hypothetical protein
MAIKMEQQVFKLNHLIKSDSWLKFWRKKPITVYVSMPHFRRLSVAGSGSIVGESTIYSDSLTLELTGSGEIELDVETKQLGSNISGSGEIRLRGSTKVFQHTISGFGDLKALNMTSIKWWCQRNLFLLPYS